MDYLYFLREKSSLVEKQNYHNLFPIVVILVPINLYFIGDNLGIGIQFALFRYQITYLGSSFITILRDLDLVFTGFIHGRTAWSIITWAEGTFLLLTAFYLNLFSNIIKILIKEAIFRKILGTSIFSGSILYLMSCMLQYGPLLQGNSGISIPIGIPVIFYLGYTMWKSERLM